MARSFASLDLVQLPRLDGASAQTLGTEIISTARDQKLSGPVSEALDELIVAHRALQSAAAQRLPTTVSEDPARTKAADIALDASWSALFDLLNAWSKLPGHAHADLATTLISQIYPEGLKFVLLPYKIEWAESQTRLLLIKDRKLDAGLEQLGAAAFLKRLRDAHKEYGDALGVTTAAKAELATTSLREALDAFCDALRHYIVCVAASARTKDSKSGELVQALLAPVQRWSSPGQAAKVPAPTTPVDAPAAPTAP
jgi:hypothetical protein